MVCEGGQKKVERWERGYTGGEGTRVGREREGGSEEIASLSQSRYQALFGCIFHSNSLWGG